MSWQPTFFKTKYLCRQCIKEYGWTTRDIVFVHYGIY